MSKRIVDLCAKLPDLRGQPFDLHFWKCSPLEYQRFLWNPRAFLKQIGILLPPRCRIETTIENHDWIGARADGLKPQPGMMICNIGGGDRARSIYRIVSFGHDEADMPKARRKSRRATARR